MPKLYLTVFIFLFSTTLNAQSSLDTLPSVSVDSLKTLKDSTIVQDSVTLAPVKAKLKEIKKLDELEVDPYIINRIESMNDSMMLDIDEELRFNFKGEDGENYTNVTRLVFAQDAIFGFRKTFWNTSSGQIPMDTIKIKIPVKFCCSSPITDEHKEQHCGFMSELNQFEDLYKCKGWVANFEKTTKTSDRLLNPKEKPGKTSKKDLKKMQEEAKKETLKNAEEAAKEGGDEETTTPAKKPSKKDLKKMKEEAKKESVENAKKESTETETKTEKKPEKPKNTTKKDIKKMKAEAKKETKEQNKSETEESEEKTPEN